MSKVKSEEAKTISVSFDLENIDNELFNRENMSLIVDQSLQREKLDRLKKIRDIIIMTANKGLTWCIFDSLIENGVFNEITYLVNAGFDVIPFTNDTSSFQCSYVVYFGNEDKVEDFKQSFAKDNNVQILDLKVEE